MLSIMISPVNGVCHLMDLQRHFTLLTRILTEMGFIGFCQWTRTYTDKIINHLKPAGDAIKRRKERCALGFGARTLLRAYPTYENPKSQVVYIYPYNVYQETHAGTTVARGIALFGFALTYRKNVLKQLSTKHVVYIGMRFAFVSCEVMTCLRGRLDFNLHLLARILKMMHIAASLWTSEYFQKRNKCLFKKTLRVI